MFRGSRTAHVTRDAGIGESLERNVVQNTKGKKVTQREPADRSV